MRTRQPIRGKRPRNTGYSSQSINARSLSARITEQKKGREKRQKQKEEKTRKRATEKNSTFQYTFRARYCTETSRSCSFRFGKTRKQISLRAVHGGSICKKHASLPYCLSKRYIRFSLDIEFEKCICEFDRWQHAEKIGALMQPDSCWRFVEPMILNFAGEFAYTSNNWKYFDRIFQSFLIRFDNSRISVYYKIYYEMCCKYTDIYLNLNLYSSHKIKLHKKPIYKLCILENKIIVIIVKSNVSNPLSCTEAEAIA